MQFVAAGYVLGSFLERVHASIGARLHTVRLEVALSCRGKGVRDSGLFTISGKGWKSLRTSYFWLEVDGRSLDMLTDFAGRFMA